MIYAYESKWVENFSREKWLLLEVLGEVIVTVHHIGSTAVPGLAARPIIDIAVESTKFPRVPAIEDTLRVLDYVPNHDVENYEIHCFKKGNPVAFCLYWHPLSPSGCQYLKNQLAFRDLLRNDHEWASRYGEIKRSLANEFHHSPLEYDRHKGTVIDALLKMASSEGLGN